MDSQKADSIVLVRLSCGGRPDPCLVAKGALQKPLRSGTPVVVETESGVAFGRVVGFVVAFNGKNGARTAEPARLIRVATEEDIAIRRRQVGREREAFRVGLLKVRERGLAMKLTRVEQLYDGSRLVF